MDTGSVQNQTQKGPMLEDPTRSGRTNTNTDKRKQERQKKGRETVAGVGVACWWVGVAS